MKTSAGCLMLLVAASMTVAAADAPPGKKTFDRYCAECHAPGHGHPGTQQLEWTRGKPFSILEDRKDLLPAYVTTVVRNGLYEMAPFRPTEINDAALTDLVAYLAPAKQAPSKKR